MLELCFIVVIPGGEYRVVSLVALIIAQSISPLRPVLLIPDGHSSHVSIQAIKFARSNDNIIIVSQPTVPHILQPLDGGVSNVLLQSMQEEHPNWVITTDQNC